MAHQLERGKKYLIFITTFSGLYRYDMHDVLEVVGHFNQAPIIRFLYKGKGMTSMAGEKLSEQQFIEAVERATERQGVEHGFFAGYADAAQSRYRLYIELKSEPDPEREEAFARAVEKALCEVNIEYEAKLGSQRLKPLEIARLAPDAFERFRELRLKEGASLSQLKWLHLSGSKTTRDRMEQLTEGQVTSG